MDGTIRENIAFGLAEQNLSFDELNTRIRDACTQANALVFIDDTKLMPDGLETVVG
jgi:ABC-type multidrug transport system fused ATPase/permease subunit